MVSVRSNAVAMGIIFMKSPISFQKEIEQKSLSEAMRVCLYVRV